MEEKLPPGFRFHPTDEELITYYLTQKVLDFGFVATAIADVDLNKCEPWDIPAKAGMGEKEWYFFSLRDRKYPTGLRTNRATEAGYWKTTGKDKEIYDQSSSTVLAGMKKTLVFYKGRAPKGEKTNWVMHEYRLQNKFPNKATKEEWVVCRIFKKNSSGKKPQHNTSSLESPCNTTTSVTDQGELIINNLANPNSGSFTNYMQSNEISSSNNNSNRMDMNLYMNWMLTRDQASSQPLLPWLGSIGPSSVLKSLPFNGYQPMETANNMSNNLNSFLGQGHTSSSSRGTDHVDQEHHEHESIWRGY